MGTRSLLTALPSSSRVVAIRNICYTPTVARLIHSSASNRAIEPEHVSGPVTGPRTVSSGPRATPEGHATGIYTGTSDQVPHWTMAQSGVQPDYSKGPTALDKAAKLFFFTEIARGGSRKLGRTAFGTGSDSICSTKACGLY